LEALGNGVAWYLGKWASGQWAGPEKERHRERGRGVVAAWSLVAHKLEVQAVKLGGPGQALLLPHAIPGTYELVSTLFPYLC